jgi:hypothetical protein
VEAEVEATMSIDGAVYAALSTAGAGERRRATLHATCSGLVECWHAISVARRLSKETYKVSKETYKVSKETYKETGGVLACHLGGQEPVKHSLAG